MGPNHVIDRQKMFSQLGKDLYNVQHRILDHRIFLAGEIESFRNNFETKRNDREVELLFKCTEAVGEIKYDLSEQSVVIGHERFQNFNLELNSVLSRVEEFLNEAKTEKPVNEKLLQSRLERNSRKDNFFKDLAHAYQRVANSFEEKEEEIADLYTDLQIKLNIPK